MLTLREAEWEALPYELAGPGNRKALGRLSIALKLRLGLSKPAIQLRESTLGQWEIRAIGFAGTIGIGGEIVDVCPRFLTADVSGGWRETLTRMVAIHYGVPIRFVGEGRAKPSKTSFFDHLGIVFAAGCRRAAQVGPILTYAPQDEVEAILRGRLDVAGQTRLLLAGRFGVAQVTNALTPDNVHMALLRWALEFLLARSRSSSVRGQLDSLHAHITPCTTRLSANEVQRAAKPPVGAGQWEEPLALARALHEAHGAGQQGNGISLPGIVFHTARMFESVVQYAVEAACGTARFRGKAWVQPAQRAEDWLHGEASSLARRVRPDSRIAEGNAVRLIVDAKNKSVRSAGETPEPNPAREDLHEVLAYMVHFNCTSACLLYPWSSLGQSVLLSPRTLTTTRAAQERRILTALLNVRRVVHASPKDWAPSLFLDFETFLNAPHKSPAED